MDCLEVDIGQAGKIKSLNKNDVSNRPYGDEPTGHKRHSRTRNGRRSFLVSKSDTMVCTQAGGEEASKVLFIDWDVNSSNTARND
jgi:hypothetical protein